MSTGRPQSPASGAGLAYDAYDTQVGVVGILASPAGLRRLGWGLEDGRWLLVSVEEEPRQR